MNRTEYTFLQAEKNSLTHLINTTPKEAVASRKNFQSRLAKVESLLKAHSMSELPIEGQITFRGKPVLGAQGIESVFAAKIMDEFSTMIAAKASSYQGPLSRMGGIANRDAYRINITGTTVGSFGFVFSESPLDQQVINGVHSPIESALADCIDFFKVIQNDDEEGLATVVDLTDERVLAEIRKFLNELLANEAVCAVESGMHSFRFNSVAEVQRSAKKIEADNIREWKEVFIGEFIGVLVSERKFDFRPSSSDVSQIKGKVSSDIDDLEEIGRSLYQKTFRVSLSVKQIGTGPLRYTLSHFEPNE